MKAASRNSTAKKRSSTSSPDSLILLDWIPPSQSHSMAPEKASSKSRPKRTRVQGQRSKKLTNAFHSTVKYALRALPLDEFITYIPPGLLSKEVLEAAFEAYCQTLHQARVFIDKEFEEICAESLIGDKLQTIDVMCAEQGYDGNNGEGGGAGVNAISSAQAGPKLARAATLKAKKEALEHLRAIKRDVEERNMELEGSLEERKAEARVLQARGIGELGARLDGVGRSVLAWEKRGGIVGSSR